MNNQKLKELGALFKILDIASVANIDFPYNKIQTSFNKKLKEFLKNHFGEDIQFDLKETFAYIQAHYKGIEIEINVYGVMILTIGGLKCRVENKEAANIRQDFEPIFTEIMGSGPICSYNYCSERPIIQDDGIAFVEGFKTVFPTIEWHHRPEDRLYELIHGWSCSPGEYMKDFNDYYTASIIKNLGSELFTVEGYKKIFDQRRDDSTYKWHKICEIRKIYPEVANEIYDWIDTSKDSISLSKKSFINNYIKICKCK